MQYFRKLPTSCVGQICMLFCGCCVPNSSMRPSDEVHSLLQVRTQVRGWWERDPGQPRTAKGACCRHQGAGAHAAPEGEHRLPEGPHDGDPGQRGIHRRQGRLCLRTLRERGSLRPPLGALRLCSARINPCTDALKNGSKKKPHFTGTYRCP